MEKERYLLEHVDTIIDKYEELIDATGERFNVFDILNVSTAEVRLHSTFLAMLLNPAGTHGMKKEGLRLFIEQQKSRLQGLQILSKLEVFDMNSASVHVEYYIGPIKKAEGGRIDILLKDKSGNLIVFENKIYAGDQDLQLVRYNSFSPSAPIFYLTLNGSLPKQNSHGYLVEGRDFVCISYERDILNWLEQMLKEAACQPLLRETIRQYTNTIKSLTGKAINKNMENEIVSMIEKNDDYIVSARNIISAYNQVLQNRSVAIKELVEHKLSEREIDCRISKWHNNFPRIEFYPNSWQNHLIGFTEERGLLFGVKRNDAKVQPISFDEVRLAIGNDWKTSPWWLCYKIFNDGVFDLRQAAPWLQQNEEELADRILDNVASVMSMLKDVSL